MTQQELLETAMHQIPELVLLPHESSIEFIFQLVVGTRIGESVLQARDEQTALNIGDVRALRSVYSLRVQPLSVILCPDRDLACFFDFIQGDLVIEATNPGEERGVIVARDEFCRHGVLGREEGARIAFAGLEKERTYTIGLVFMRSPDSLIEEAERIWESGKSHPKALTLLERALNLNPRLHAAWRRKAYILRELGRGDEALSAAEQSILVNPNYALGWRCKGAILRDMNQDEMGLDCYVRSLALDPTDSVCLTNKGNALMALGRKQEAREAYEEAERIRGLYPERH